MGAHRPARGLAAGAAAEVLQHALGLGLVAASVTWAVASVVLAPELLPWVAQGVLSLRPRLELVGLVLGVGGAVFVVAAHQGYRHPAGARTVHSWARVGAPLALVGVLPHLCSRSAWLGNELGQLVMAGLAGLYAERTLRPCLEELGVARLVGSGSARSAYRLGWGLVLLAAVYYAVTVARLTLISHHSLATRHSDLSEFNNLFYNTLDGHPFRAPATLGDRSDWGFLRVHAPFVLFALLPVYSLDPRPETLLLLQAVGVALTALPLYAFAVRRVGPALAVAFVVAFLLWPAVEQPSFFDFHFLALSLPLVMTAIALADRLDPGVPQRGLILALFGVAVLTMLTREDLTVGLAVLGLVLVFSGRHPRVGLGLAGLAVAYFVGVKLWLMPRFGDYWLASLYADLQAPGCTGLTGVLLGALSHPARLVPYLLAPEKVVYVLHLAAPLVFLWWRRPWGLLALAPGALFTLCVTNRPLLISFQYAFFFVPYVLAASVLCAEATLHASPPPAPHSDVARRWALVGGLVLASTLLSCHQGALLGNRTIRGDFTRKPLVYSPEARARYERLQALVRDLPPSARVTASEFVSPHVSSRSDVYRLSWGVPPQSDYIVTQTTLLPEERGPLLTAVRGGSFGLVVDAGDLLLLARGAPPTRTLERRLR